MSTPTGSNPSINDIVKCITDGEFRIPRFQRDFVWDIKKSASLLDSILKGFPISSVILWKTKNELSEIRNLGGVIIPGKDTGRYTSYVIDGQQRMTSLYFALKGLKTASGMDFSEMCISLVADKKEQLVYDALPKDADAADYVSLKSLFDASALGGSHAEKRLEYYQTLLQYKISVIEIDDDNLELDDVIEVFERLNLGGKKLNLFSIIAARSYKSPDNTNPGFDLAKKFEDLNKTLSDKNYGKISDSVFLLCIAACLIEKVNKAEILRNLNTDIIEAHYADVEKAILAAVEHLKGKNYGVLVSKLLPYERMIVPFAYFHYHIGNKQITSHQETYMVDYFWRCIIGKRYNSSADTNMNSDLSKVKKILDGEIPAQEAISLSPKSIFENGRFTLSSAYVIGILCLLAQSNPQSFAVGRTINITNDAVTNSASKQYHHFFPMKSDVILNDPDNKAIVNNVVNIVLMDATTNDQISNRNPSDYISEFEKLNPNLSSALNSHFISRSGFGIDTDDFKCFIKQRSLSMFNKLCNFIKPNSHDSILPTDAI